MKTMRQWLEALGLGRYTAAFEGADVDLDILETLTDEDLHRLGVSLGDRKRIFRALQDGDATALPLEPAKLRPPTDTTPPSIESLTAQGERRQVTVLFCDLVGSTALSNTRDPEEYRSILARYHGTCIVAVQRFEGFVAQIQGDGIVAYFGYPLAHEAEAERAVRAGLSIVDALSELDGGFDQLLRVRIGIASGMVVVSHILAPDKSAVGETPNLAARLQTLAQPGDVIVGDRTRSLACGSFEYEDRGVHALKGIAEATRAWKVLSTSGAASRFEAATRGGLTPMVGREQEIALLLDRWEVSRAGEGQVMLLEGEPGIGKSRMLRAFRERLGPKIQLALQYQCSPYYTNSALYPIADHLERTMRFDHSDSFEQKLDKIERRLLDELGRSRTDCHLLSRALSLPGEARYGALAMSPQRQKDETIALLVDIVAQVASKQACVVLFEDIHWADPSTIEALNALVDRTEGLPLLVLITYRPEFQPAWTSRSHVAPIVLTRLSRAQGASIVLRVAQDKPLPADLVTQVVDKTDGVPLFLEELTKAVLESDLLVDAGERYDYSGAVSKLAIPATLRDSLMARLDRLIPVKEIAQIGSVLGREFSYELVRAVSPMDEAQLDEALNKLTASELVFRRGTPPQAVYIFKHALVQDAAYDSLLKSKRQVLHAQIAQAIRERFPSKAETEPELLAHHYTEAGMPVAAIPCWQKAGQLAQQRVALQEAIQHYEKGLGLIRQLPASAERDTYELRLRALLGMACMGLYGYNHPQVAANLDAALRLDQSLDGGDYTLRVLWGSWVYRLAAGRVEESVAWAERLIATAEQVDSENMRLAGHWAACDSYFFLGNFAQAIHHADIIVARYDAERDRHVAELINHDPKTIALAYKAAAEWMLGYPDQAVATADAAISNARERNHAFDLCWGNVFVAAYALNYRRDAVRMATCLDWCERIAKDQHLSFFSEVYCPLVRASWLSRSDRPREAESQFRSALPQWVAAGLGIVVPDHKALHAESCLQCGDIASALSLLDEALEQIQRPGWQERCGLSNVLRVKGLALHLAGKTSEAEAVLQDALQTAREQNAKSWELCAATSYARLLREQERFEEARSLLRPVYEWFTEGHDTRDLQEAAVLLAELEAQRVQPVRAQGDA